MDLVLLSLICKGRLIPMGGCPFSEKKGRTGGWGGGGDEREEEEEDAIEM